MALADRPKDPPSAEEAIGPPTVPPARRADAWELVEPGRYRPRRIRGSFPGRELG